MSTDSYPILRLAIPLAAGIFFAGSVGWEPFPLLAGLSLGLFLLLAGVTWGFPYRYRWFFGVGVPLFLFLAGGTLTELTRRRVQAPWPEAEQTWQAVVLDSPRAKSRVVQCPVEVEGRRVFLSLRRDSLSESLHTGDGLVFRSRIRLPENFPGSSFNYVRYLLCQGVGGISYASDSRWRLLETPPERTWKQEALRLREQLVSRFRQWGIGEEQLPVFVALTIGHKAALDDGTRDVYSVAGIAHVLALSGMHIALVWALLERLLRPLAFVPRFGKALRWLVSTLLLWTFAFVVGLEASVVRAVVMCMLVGLGQAVGTRSFSFNTLGVAALFMLLYRPHYLFDVGFQLSFVAVASILLFFPPLYERFAHRRWPVRFAWSVVCISVSAQLGTAPLVMYYFSNFSVHFLWANLVASLLVPFILFGAFGLVVFSFVPVVREVLAWGLDKLVSLLNLVAEGTASLPAATFSLPLWEPFQITLYYVVLGFFLVYVKTGLRRWLLWTLGAVVGLLCVRLCLFLAG